jgi:hypothetical protein
MSYKDKIFTVRKIVDKVIATKEKITICGMIQSYANSMSVQKVGLNAKHWYDDFITQLPFELKLQISK